MLQRLVVCIKKGTTLDYETIFGVFTNTIEITQFLVEHEKICKRTHVVRKMENPKFGIK